MREKVGGSLHGTTSRRRPDRIHETKAGPKPERPDTFARAGIVSLDDRRFQLLRVNQSQRLKDREVADKLPAALRHRGSEVKHERDDKAGEPNVTATPHRSEEHTSELQSR